MLMARVEQTQLPKLTDMSVKGDLISGAGGVTLSATHGCTFSNVRHLSAAQNIRSNVTRNVDCNISGWR